MKYFLEMNPLMEKEEFHWFEDAMKYADENATYNGYDMVVYDEDHDEVCRRRWYGVEFDPDYEDEDRVIKFGTFGYYAPWEFSNDIDNSYNNEIKR